MKILAFADSHTDIDTMFCVVTKESPDMVVHLGDHIADGMDLKNRFNDIPMHLVSGNTDGTYNNINEKFLNISNKQLFITHGHLYNVKSGMAEIYRKGSDIGADVVLFGHTHKPYLSYAGGIWLMNPGRIGRKSIRTHATYGIVRIENERIRCEIIEAP